MQGFTGQDAQFMARAIALAKRGRFTTTPNPNVGCVIVNPQGQIVGEGWHHQAGTPHAEIHALTQAGKAAAGATVYVTLEPCSHYGRTPPCADALIQAKVGKVVAAMVDPNPQVAGNGLKRLQQAGINTCHGLLQRQAAQLNPGFCKRMQHHKPLVTVKLAASMDGKTALANGRSQWITGPAARRDVQLHRAASCAILSGSGTVLADNPSLNVRAAEIEHGLWDKHRLRQPLRVIIDSRNQLTADLRLFQLPGDILIANRCFNPALDLAAVSQWQGPMQDGKLDLCALMQHLATLQINQLWVEAGARLAGALLKEKLIDQLILYQAPKLIGHRGRDLLELPELQQMDQLYQLQAYDVRMLGNDIKQSMQVIYP